MTTMTWSDQSGDNDGRPAFQHEVTLSGVTVATVSYHEIATGAWQATVSIMDSLAMPGPKTTHEHARMCAVRLAQALRLLYPETDDQCHTDTCRRMRDTRRRQHGKRI